MEKTKKSLQSLHAELARLYWRFGLFSKILWKVIVVIPAFALGIVKSLLSIICLSLRVTVEFCLEMFSFFWSLKFRVHKTGKESGIPGPAFDIAVITAVVLSNVLT